MIAFTLGKDFLQRTIVDIINKRFNIKQDFEYIYANSDLKMLSRYQDKISWEGHFMFIDDKGQYQDCYYMLLEDKNNVFYVLPVIL